MDDDATRLPHERPQAEIPAGPPPQGGLPTPGAMTAPGVTEDDPAAQDVHAAGDDSVDRGALILAGLRAMAAWSWRFLLVVAALAVILYIVGKVWVGVLPILLALIVSSVLWPPVRWLRDHRVPGALASVLVLLGAIGTFVAIIAAISPSVAGQSREVASRASEGIDAIVEWLAGPPLEVQSDQLDR